MIKGTKTHFLLVILLFTVVSASPQELQKNTLIGITNRAEQMANRYTAIFELPDQGIARKKQDVSYIWGNVEDTKTNLVTASTVKRISGSISIYGVLISQTKPLQWNDNINGISFIHRKSSSYVSIPFINSNSSTDIIAMLSADMGNTWDSTCLWVTGSHFQQFAKFPQGGIYSSPGNTNYSAAYVIATGPVCGSFSEWTGSFYASKSVTATPKNAGAIDQQVATNGHPSFTPKLDFSRYSFSSTDDGSLRSIGGIYEDVNGATLASRKFRGGIVVKGGYSSYNGGVFYWNEDSLLPPTECNSAGGYKYLSNIPIMAWNEQGTVGYVVFIGVRSGQILSNKGYQPIIYKTTNSGVSWLLLNGIDFNAPSMQLIKKPLTGTKSNPSVVVPFFNIGEGFDAVVDGNNNLHLVTTIISGYSQHIDSLDYSYTFGTAKTSWPFISGSMPYIYDFVGDGSSAWKAYVIDSMQTEGPGGQTGEPGYNENPWFMNPFDHSKIISDSRIQLSRSVTGDRIAVVWAEGDTSITNSKWLCKLTHKLAI